MTTLGAGADELSAALAALDRIAEIVAEGREAFDASFDRQLALVFCWVNVGSLLKQFSRRVGVRHGAEPLAGPIKMRDKLVYGALSDLRPDVVWQTCVLDGPNLRRLLTDLLAAL